MARAPMLSGVAVSLCSTVFFVLSHNHCPNNGLGLEREESCHNDYHPSFAKKLPELGIEKGLSFSQALHATD